MMTMLLLVLLVSVAVLSVQAKYFLVEGERCEVLTNATTMFDKLLPCAQYSVDAVDLQCLTAEQTTVAMKQVPNWTLTQDSEKGDNIRRDFVFGDFQTAFYFMTKSAQLAEKNQHHPNWSNLYNTVNVVLNTDDKLCLSTFDIELAKGMDKIAADLLLQKQQN